MKTRIIIIIFLLLTFLGGFIYFEKKKGEFGLELDKAKADHSQIIEKQIKIEELKKKRAEYFEKVFMINRPGDINRSLTGLISVLIMMDNRSVRFSKINIESRTGAIEFEIAGYSRKAAYLLDLTDKLESSAGVFIISKIVSEKNPKEFIIRGEVAAE